MDDTDYSNYFSEGQVLRKPGPPLNMGSLFSTNGKDSTDISGDVENSAGAAAATGNPLAAIGVAVLGNVLKDIQRRRQMALEAKNMYAQSQASP